MGDIQKQNLFDEGIPKQTLFGGVNKSILCLVTVYKANPFCWGIQKQNLFGGGI